MRPLLAVAVVEDKPLSAAEDALPRVEAEVGEQNALDKAFAVHSSKLGLFTSLAGLLLESCRPHMRAVPS